MPTVMATSGNGVWFQWRRSFRLSEADNQAAGTGNAETTYPLFLRVTRLGDSLSAFQSTDGSNYAPIGDPVAIPNLSKTTYAGLAVTAHAEGKTAAARFDAASLKFE